MIFFFVITKIISQIQYKVLVLLLAIHREGYLELNARSLSHLINNMSCPTHEFEFYLFKLFSEEATRRFLFLKNSQNLQEITCIGIYF